MRTMVWVFGEFEEGWRYGGGFETNKEESGTNGSERKEKWRGRRFRRTKSGEKIEEPAIGDFRRGFLRTVGI